MIVYGSLQDEMNLANWRSQKPRRRSATQGKTRRMFQGEATSNLVPAACFLPSALRASGGSDAAA